LDAGFHELGGSRQHQVIRAIEHERDRILGRAANPADGGGGPLDPPRAVG
jgi:hypothetical protein